MGAMECKTVWQEGMNFKNDIRGHQFVLDAKSDHGGQDAGPTPKEILLAGIAGCSGMDIVSLLKKMRQPLAALQIETKTTTTEGAHPVIFARVDVEYHATGDGLDAAKVADAVKKSMTKYCGVSAMISKASPIFYKVFVNGQLADEAPAIF